MARVTVEDCLENVKNRFELVILASKRARQLMRGSSEPKVAWENDKATVVALREIAMGYTDFSDAHHADNHRMQHHATVTETVIIEDDSDDDIMIEASVTEEITENTTPETTTETPTSEDVPESDQSEKSE